MKFNYINVKGENAGKISFSGILFSTLIVTIVLIGSLFLFAVLVTYTPLDIKYASALANVVFYIGAFVSGIVSGKKGKNNGWFRGLSASVIYFGIFYVISSVLSGEVFISFHHFTKLLFSIFAGVTGGIVGVNLK